MHKQQTAFENIVGKEEIARNEQFLLFQQCFLLDQKILSPFVNIYDIISLFAAELEEGKIVVWGKGLRYLSPEDRFFFFFRSPEHYSGWPIVVDHHLAYVRPWVCVSLNNYVKHLLWNRWTDFNETSQKLSLGNTLSEYLKQVFS